MFWFGRTLEGRSGKASRIENRLVGTGWSYWSFWDFALWALDNESTNQCQALEKVSPNLLKNLKASSSYCKPFVTRHFENAFLAILVILQPFSLFFFGQRVPSILPFLFKWNDPSFFRDKKKSLMPPRTSKIFKGCFCNINNSSPSLIPIFWAQPSLDTFRIHTCDAGGQGSICSPKSPSSQETVKKPSSTCPSFLIFKSSTSDTTFVPPTSLLFFWDLYRSCAFFFLQFAWSFVEETASVSAFKAGRKIKWSGRGSKASWNRIQLAWIDKQI